MKWSNRFKQMVAGELPGMEDHQFELQKNHIVCTACKGRILRNSARDKLWALAQAQCWNRAWEPMDTWQGHASHSMWRQGGKLFCTQCRAHAIHKGQDFSASKSSRQPCGLALVSKSSQLIESKEVQSRRWKVGTLLGSLLYE